MNQLSNTSLSLKSACKLIALVIACTAICMRLKQAGHNFISSDPRDYLILALSLLLANSYYRQTRRLPLEMAP